MKIILRNQKFYSHKKVFFLNFPQKSNSLGSPGVDTHVRHEGESACTVIQMVFLVNEGALVTATADDTLHLWNFRQKCPQIVQSLKFQREKYVNGFTL